MLVLLSVLASGAEIRDLYRKKKRLAEEFFSLLLLSAVGLKMW